MKICNKCEHNRNGVCDICGCVLKLKTRSMLSVCALEELGMYPKWEAEKEVRDEA